MKFYFDNGKNLFQTSKKISLNTKNILQCIQATSSPFPNFLFPVTSQVTWPPCKIKYHTIRNTLQGKLQPIPPHFTMETAYFHGCFLSRDVSKGALPIVESAQIYKRGVHAQHSLTMENVSSVWVYSHHTYNTIYGR